MQGSTIKVLHAGGGGGGGRAKAIMLWLQRFGLYTGRPTCQDFGFRAYRLRREELGRAWAIWVSA